MGWIKDFLDNISPWVPVKEVQEAEKDNIKFDRNKVDTAIHDLLVNKDEFVEAVNHLTRTLNYERRKDKNGG